MAKRYYRYDTTCTDAACYCHMLSDTLSVRLHDCTGCHCTWSDEPPGAGRDPYGRPDPSKHPEYWTE
jgi:hypothetical protein